MVSGYKRIILLVLLVVTTALLTYSYLYPRKAAKKSSDLRTKVLLIGLDGASWNVIQPLLEQNKLPNIKRLIDSGCWGSLESPGQTLISDVIWTTIATGKTPQKHGILDRLMENPDTGKLIPVSSNIRKSKALWNILSENGRTVGMIGYRNTWPPEKVNRVMISDRAIKMDYFSEDYSCPPIRQLCSRSEFENFKKNNKEIAFLDNPNALKAVMKDAFMANFAVYLKSKLDFDLFTLYLCGTDWVSHLFWKYFEPNGFNVSKQELEKYGNVINDYYIYCDKIIGDLLNKIDENTVVIVVSDHGFTADKEKCFFTKLNYVLELSGLSRIKSDDKTIIIHEGLAEGWRNEKNIEIEGELSKEGLVNIKERIKKQLSRIRTEEDNRAFFDSITYTSKGLKVILDKPYINLYPDRHLIINDKKYKVSDFLTENSFSGSHDNFGIIIISGKHIRRGVIKSASVYDIAPTVLHLMGLPVARDMDGAVLAEAIEKDFLDRRPVKYIGTYETGAENKNQMPIPSPMDEELKEGMRSLGYIN